MRIPSKKFWIQESLFALLFFLFAIVTDYVLGEEDQSLLSYYVKEAVRALIFSFMLALILAPDNPFKEKGHRSSNLT